MAAKRTSPDLVIRRKMRKGTHSCFECRRRKIRCIFPADNSNVCTECFARGSRCIDQEHADPETIVDHRKNLRERVSRLESLVDQLLDDRTERGAAETLSALKGRPFPHTPLSADATPSVTGANDHAPLLSLFNNEVLSRADSQSDDSLQSDHDGEPHSFAIGTTANGTQVEFQCAGTDRPSLTNLNASAAREKRERTRRALLGVLPPFERITEILKNNGSWWLTFRSKCPGTTSKYKDLVDFASSVYKDGSPPQIGLLALAVGISIEGDDLDAYLALVDRWITSDDEYASTLEGMECLLLQAKCYADIGQPRKAWLIYRKGLGYAQLLGLHRTHATSLEKDSIWWMLFSGDRFLSLLLGLPYGVPDSHCDLEPKGPLVQAHGPHFAFLAGISIIAGKVIDRCQQGPDQSLSAAIELDTQLDKLAAQVPGDWWDINPLLIDIHRPQTAIEFRDRVLSQIAFHQIRIYLHLPFMLQSASNSKYDYSRSTCLNSSRDLLRLYQSLRSGNAEPLYECKSVDFVGFTAAILVLLGLLGYGRVNNVHDPKQEEADWRMIEISMDIFQRASSEKGGKVAAQSYKVLQQLSQVRHLDANDEHTEHYSKIAIPYFGTISIRRGQRFTSKATPSSSFCMGGKSTPSDTSLSPSALAAKNTLVQAGMSMNPFPTPPLSTHTQNTPTPSDTSNLNEPSPQQMNVTDPFIAYDGFYMPHGFDQNAPQLGHEDTLASLGTGSWGMGFPMGFAPSQMDIDQDWTMFLADQNAATGFAGGQQQQQQQQQGQNQQGAAANSNFFTAFG